MKKILSIAVLIFTTYILCAQSLSVFQKKDDLSDFSSKVTKVVVQGNNSLDDIMLIDAVKKNWVVSKYEVCTMGEFDRIKSDTSYYFLLRVDGQLSREKAPSMEFLTLIKGDPKGEQGIGFMPEVLSLPYRALDDNSGDSFAYLEPFICIIQSHVAKIQNHKLSAYIGVSAYSDAMSDAGGHTILFCEEDFGFEVTQEMLDGDFNGFAKLVSKEEKERAISQWDRNTLVSIVIAPDQPQKGSYCFKMLINTYTRELYLFKRHKLTPKMGAGITPEDYKKMALPYAR